MISDLGSRRTLGAARELVSSEEARGLRSSLIANHVEVADTVNNTVVRLLVDGRDLRPPTSHRRAQVVERRKVDVNFLR